MELDIIKATLDDRGKRYGEFASHAEISQALKGIVRAHIDNTAKVMAADQVEAIEMILHKLGRILNGDPDYADSWVDIAGYAKLVADRLSREDK